MEVIEIVTHHEDLEKAYPRVQSAHKPNPPTEVDIQRAALCCAAVKHDVAAASDLFGRYRELHFQDVVMSPAEQGHRILVATARDGSGARAVYVAFAGTSSLADIFPDATINLAPFDKGYRVEFEGSVPGGFHRGFYYELPSSIRPMQMYLYELLRREEFEKPIRMFFCGHSMGGTIAHMALLMFLLSGFLAWVKEDGGQVAEIMSIAFGSPHFCDSRAADYLRQQFSEEDLFFNYFNEGDPVPLLLNGLPATVTATHDRLRKLVHDNLMELSKVLLSPMPQETSHQLAPIVKKCEKALSTIYTTLGKAKSNKDVMSKDLLSPVSQETSHQVARIGKKCKKVVSTICTTLGKALSTIFTTVGKALSTVCTTLGMAKSNNEDESDRYVRLGKAKLNNVGKSECDIPVGKAKSNNEGEKVCYVPFGRYTRYGRKASNCVDHGDMQNMDVELQNDNFQAHLLNNYFLSTGLHPSPESQVSPPKVRQGPRPSVTKAVMRIIQGDSRTVHKARIIVKGTDLSLLVDRECKVKAFGDLWHIDDSLSSTDRLVLQTMRNLTVAELNELTKAGDGNVVTSILVVTAFGYTGYEDVYLEDASSTSNAMIFLRRAVSKLLIVIDTDRGEAKHRDEQSGICKRLKGIADLANCNKEMDDLLKNFADNQVRLHERRKKAEDEFVAKIKSGLCNDPIKLDGKNGGPLVPKSLFTSTNRDKRHRGIATSSTVLTCLSVPIAQLFVGSVPYIISLGDLAIFLQKNRVLSEYSEILKWVYYAAVQSDDDGSLSTPDEMPSKDMENAVYNRIGLEERPEWISKQDHCVRKWMSKRFQEDAKDFLSQNAVESTISRMKLLFGVMALQEAAKDLKVVAVIGPENAGKSTLINLLKSGAYAKAGVGYLSHTDDVKGYRVNDHMIAIDCPGTSAPSQRKDLSEFWKVFQSDICVVLVTFTGDVTKEAQELLERAETMSPNVILLVTHVDNVLKGRPQSSVWNEFNPDKMDTLREAFRRARSPTKLLDTVLFCILSEDGLNDPPETHIKQLKDRKVFFPHEVAEEIKKQCELVK